MCHKIITDSRALIRDREGTLRGFIFTFPIQCAAFKLSYNSPDSHGLENMWRSEDLKVILRDIRGSNIFSNPNDLTPTSR